ncbi:MAG: tetratricopeptide repeat protein [Proteobacteria bacterium]|nr:tetratricopeptide repeat protein [Pseudomonadota bacterium]
MSAIDMDPKQASSWHMCGEALLTLQNFEEAERYLAKAIELNPECTEAFADFGELYLQKGDSGRALSYFERALQLEPGNRKALWGKRKLSSSR